MEVIAGLMVESRLLQNQSEIYHEFNELSRNSERTYNELHTGMWWQSTESELRARHGNDSFLLPVIVFLDATQLDVTGKLSAKPVCITLGNFSIKLRVFNWYLT